MEKSKEHKGGLGRLLGGFGKKDDLDEQVLERLEEKLTVETAGELPPEPEAEPTFIEVREGSLLRLWHQWRGEHAPPPYLSLLGDLERDALPLDDQGISRERVRLKAQLEKDAMARLRLMEDNMKKEGAPPLNAVCHVHISRSGMVAWAFLFPPSAPEGELSLECVGKAMQENNVTTGIDSAAVLRLLQEKSYFKLVPIARGTPAVEGTNGSVTELYSREIVQEVKVDENGIADYRSLNYVRMVNAGDVICDITPPQPGTSGVRVDGKVVEPKPVRAAKLPAGANTTVSEDGLHLVATREGHLEFSGDSFHVRPVLEIKGDVDYSTGNIDFHGDVHVYGDVRENFVVRATGSVTVDGLVEGATVEAGGDVLISCGALGDNRTLLKSGGCIRAKYLENCVAYAAQCVYADCIMSSQIFSDDAINVTSGRGTVIGGTLTAAYTIKARMIGSQSGRRTTIVLGVLPYVQEKLNNDEVALESIRKELQELEKELRYLEERHGLEGTSEKLAKVHLRKSVLAMKESQILKRRERLEPLSPDLTKCRLECDMVYPITCLTIQEATLRVEQARRRYKATFDFHTGEIREGSF